MKRRGCFSMSKVELEIKLPKHVVAFTDRLFEMEPETIISGGYLVDLYFGLPHNDIDVFMHHQNKSEVLKKLRTMGYSVTNIGDDYVFLMESERGVYEVKDSGETYQLIFTNRGKGVLDLFDLTFKKIYYDGVSVFAERETIHDLKRKEITIDYVSDEKKTLLRALSAKDKYGFSFNVYTKKVINHLCHKYKSDPKFMDSVEKGKYKRFKEAIINNQPSYGSDILAGIGYITSVMGSGYDLETKKRLMDVEPLREVLEIAIKPDPLIESVKEKEEKIRSIVRKNKLRLMYLSQDLLEEWRGYENDHIYLYDVFREKVLRLYRELGESFLDDILNLFLSIDEDRKVLKDLIGEKTKVEFSNYETFIEYGSDLDIEAFLRNELIMCYVDNIDNIDGGQVVHCLIDLNKWTIIKSNIRSHPEPCHTVIMSLIKEEKLFHHLNDKKELI